MFKNISFVLLFSVCLNDIFLTKVDSQYSSVKSFLNRIRPSRWNKRQENDDSYFKNQNGKNLFFAGTCFTQERLPGRCQPLASCFYQYDNLEQIRANYCPLGQNLVGVCCPTHMYRSTGNVFFRFKEPKWPFMQLPIDKQAIIYAVKKTENELQNFLDMETNFLRVGGFQRPNTMASYHQGVFGPPSDKLLQVNLNGFRALQVTRLLGDKFCANPRQMRDGLWHFDLYGTPYEQYCPPIPQCNPMDKYRTIDGSCNNLNHPVWGRSVSQYSRILPPSYSDGISEFRLSVSGRPLPLARFVSTQLTNTSSQLDPVVNVMFMQWGQLLDHDMTLGSSTRAANGQGLLCCNQTNLESESLHPACRPIIIPNNDPFYSRFNRRCNNFVRNAVGIKNDCTLGYREQTNVITSFLDASPVYGNDLNRSRIVRTFKNGLLRVSQINGREFLPYDTMNNSLVCSIPPNARMPGNAQKRCVYAGDVRVNQQTGITTLQLFFLREHNRLSRELKNINPHWNDEKIFQEARRIVGAEFQQITYNEWLPLALGRSAMRANDLMLKTQGYSNAYDLNINPAIMNEFAASAYRWHTFNQGFYQRLSANGKVRENYRMRTSFNNPTLMYRDGVIDEVTYGLLAAKCESFDPIFVDDTKNFLFPAGEKTFGLDLVSIDIQRERDHGTPPYNEIRKVCGLPKIRNFQELNGILQPGMAEKFAQIYEHVDDIELFVAGHSEIPLPEGLVGPTFACIVTEQFKRLKNGDRFWFENGNMPNSFTLEQLNEIRKVTLSGILCANGDNIHQLQPFAMIAKSNLNQNIDCQTIPRMDLSFWRE